MNTINTHKKENCLSVTVHGFFNLYTKKRIMSHITPGITKMCIHLNNCDLIDSEGVIFLHRWIDSGNELEISNPPAILYEILDILELTRSWDLDEMITH